MLVSSRAAAPRVRPICELDLRRCETRHHTSVVFEHLEDLGPDGRLSLTSAYEPEALRQKIQAWCLQEFDWNWVEQGPRIWRTEISRRRR